MHISSVVADTVIRNAAQNLPFTSESVLIFQIHVSRVIDGLIARIVEHRVEGSGGNAFLAPVRCALEGEIPVLQVTEEIVKLVAVCIHSYPVVCCRVIEFW